MMRSDKKMNTYLKYGVILLVAALAGGVMGFSMMAFGIDGVLKGISPFVLSAVEFVKKYMLWELLGLLLIEVILGESSIHKMKTLASELETTEDEEGDRVEYEMENLAAFGIGAQAIISFLAVIILSTGYSVEYIKSVEDITVLHMLLGAFAAFMAIYAYEGYWSVRIIKLQQKWDPKKKGDPTSMKFTEQWVESCDEAEKELIYQSAYKSYTFMMKCVPVLMMIALFLHLIWNTGIMAVIFTGIIWLMVSISYLKNCVEKRKQKLSR